MGKRQRPGQRKREKKELTGFKVGDPVIVKAGVTDPDFGTEISVWQGRITRVDEPTEDSVLITIQWDNITLQKMSLK